MGTTKGVETCEETTAGYFSLEGAAEPIGCGEANAPGMCSCPSAARSSAADAATVGVGAGVGVLVIVVIVVLVVMRQKQGSKRGAAPSGEKSNVSFENPLYDAGSKDGADNSGPTDDDDDAYDDDGGGGLYDDFDTDENDAAEADDVGYLDVDAHEDEDGMYDDFDEPDGQDEEASSSPYDDGYMEAGEAGEPDAGDGDGMDD